MCSSSCKTAMQSGCGPKSCPTMKARRESSSIIIWIAAVDENTTHLFVQKNGHKIEPLSIGCGCGLHAGAPKNMAKYLDGALACGQYDGLVLVGSQEALQAVKKLLNTGVYNRIIAEIPDTLAGKGTEEILHGITEQHRIFSNK